MTTKLTLSLSKSVIEGAKVYAKSQKRSLSSIVEEYLKTVAEDRPSPPKPQSIHSLVEELSGSISVPKDMTYDELLAEAIMERYAKR